MASQREICFYYLLGYFLLEEKQKAGYRLPATSNVEKTRLFLGFCAARMLFPVNLSGDSKTSEEINRLVPEVDVD